MSKHKTDTSYNPFTLNRNSWSKLAQKYKNHVSIITYLLDHGSGSVLNGGELQIESRGILAFLLQEVDSFDAMSHADITKTARTFIGAYLDYRDAATYSWMDDVDASDDSFEQSFIRIARLAKNSVNQMMRPKPPEFRPGKLISY